MAQTFLSAVSQVFNLRTARLFERGGDCADARRQECRQYGVARQSRNPNGARLWSKTQPQHIDVARLLRLEFRTQPLREIKLTILDYRKAAYFPPNGNVAYTP